MSVGRAWRLFFLREYIEGKSLYEYIQKNGTFSYIQILKIGIEICRIIGQFQKEENPLIHRDIKPENLILADDGRVVLVDFGTVRSYRMNGSSRDTFLIGSEGTAAPEQYGCRQTDQRTDVYAIGRTLWFLAAGDYDEEALGDAKISRNLLRVIRKATSFDPEKRYASAEKLEKALSFCLRTRNYQVSAAVLLLAALMAGGAWYYVRVQGQMQDGVSMEMKAEASETTGAGTKVQAETEEKESVVYEFREPLIEQAVRRQLGIGEDEPVTEEMLDRITDLKIIGDLIVDTDFFYDTAQYAVDGMNAEPARGDISDLEDLAHMKNLYNVFLGRQEITDISPLANLSIHTLGLTENSIEDFSPVQTLPNLENLYLGGCQAKNLDGSTGCTGLVSLNLDNMHLENLNFLEDLPVQNLSMWVTAVENGDLEPLAKMKNLGSLQIWLSEGEIQPEVLSRIEGLGLLAIGGYNFPDFSEFGDMADLTSLAVYGEVNSLKGLEHFPQLDDFAAASEKLHDITEILLTDKLESLNIASLILFDFSPLIRHPGLKTLICSEKQKEEILKQEPLPEFEMITG